MPVKNFGLMKVAECCDSVTFSLKDKTFLFYPSWVLRSRDHQTDYLTSVKLGVVEKKINVLPQCFATLIKHFDSVKSVTLKYTNYVYNIFLVWFLFRDFHLITWIMDLWSNWFGCCQEGIQKDLESVLLSTRPFFLLDAGRLLDCGKQL